MKTKKIKKVMCFGTFDIMHPGHVDYFRQARKWGDYLVVVVARDETKKKMGKEIIFDEKERLEMVGSLEMVDEAVLGYLDDYYKIILEKKPEVICLGYDHKIEVKELKEELKRLGLKPEIKRMKAYQAHKHKSSKIREIILKL